MASQLILRQSVLRTSALSRSIPARTGIRSVHFENKVGNNMPFSYANKAALGTGIVVFFISGFSLPFIASVWQISKSGTA